MLKKPDRGLEFCVNFHDLNKTTVSDQFLLTHMEDLVDALAKSKAYRGLDLRSRYWKMCITEGSIEYTAFVTQLSQ